MVHPLLATFFFSGSVSLARVTPLFLAVAGFLSFRTVSTFSRPETKRDGSATLQQKISPNEFLSARYRVTRATGSDPVGKTRGNPMISCRSLAHPKHEFEGIRKRNPTNSSASMRYDVLTRRRRLLEVGNRTRDREPNQEYDLAFVLRENFGGVLVHNSVIEELALIASAWQFW